jgi:hypothetical protein
MQCPNCSSQLPQGANACPACGAVSPAFHVSAGSSPDSSTVILSAGSSQVSKSAEEGRVASWSPGSQAPIASDTPQRPPTYYGSQPYANEPNPYERSASNPYGDSYASSPYSTDPPPPPPSIHTRKKRALFVVLLSVAILALVGTGFYAFMVMPSTQRANTTQNQSISPARRQALYHQTVGTMPVMRDPLNRPDDFGWDNYSGQGGNTRCFFRQGQLHAVAQPSYFSPCYAKATNYQNFLLQATMTIISGHSGGLVFRADSTNDKGYQFRISTNGTYILNRIILDQKGNIQSDGETVASGSSASIQQGTNQLAVMAQGNILSLFINGNYVESAADSTYHSGQVGVYVDSDASSVEGAFSDLHVWKLSIR